MNSVIHAKRSQLDALIQRSAIYFVDDILSLNNSKVWWLYWS